MLKKDLGEVGAEKTLVEQARRLKDCDYNSSHVSACTFCYEPRDHTARGLS